MVLWIDCFTADLSAFSTDAASHQGMSYIVAMAGACDKCPLSLCNFMLCRELEAQVQDLREVCKTSAADRAASAAAASQRTSVPPPPVKLPPLTSRSTILTPSAGPVVIPGNLVSMSTPDPSPPRDTSSSSSSPSREVKLSTDSRRASKSSIESDTSGANDISVQLWAKRM